VSGGRCRSAVGQLKPPPAVPGPPEADTAHRFRLRSLLGEAGWVTHRPLNAVGLPRRLEQPPGEAHQSLPLRFAAHAVTGAVEVVRVWWLDRKVVERNICTVQIGRRRRDADSRIGRIAAIPAPTATSRRGLLRLFGWEIFSA
jgi:hypothetical protein